MQDLVLASCLSPASGSLSSTVSNGSTWPRDGTEAPITPSAQSLARWALSTVSVTVIFPGVTQWTQVLAAVSVTRVLYTHTCPGKWGLYFPQFPDEGTEVQGSVNNLAWEQPGWFQSPSLSLHCRVYWPPVQPLSLSQSVYQGWQI